MLILPAEQKVNWRRPPYATLVLILFNIFVYVNLQSQDDELLDAAYGYYVSKGLAEFEAPEYADFLQRFTNLNLDSRQELALEVRQAVDAGNIAPLVPLMLNDRQFVNYIRAEGLNFIAPDQYKLWLQHRELIEVNYLNQLSYWRMGLIPADIQLPDLLSYQFIHGSIEHLVSNMLMLFLTGFAIEIILGKALYLIAYMASGAVGGLLFALTEGESLTPLVGASASISALMGMYVMYYRLQHIRFFYFVIFYFNYFRAPALLLLPVWLGKEIYEYATSASVTVAYLAHAGGLVAGAALMWPWVHWVHKSAEPVKTHEELDEEHRKNVAEALNAVSQVEFDKARLLFTKILKQYPQDEKIALHLFHLYKLRPDSAECRHYSELVLDRALSRGKLDEAFSLWEEYQKYSQQIPLANHRYDFRLLTDCFKFNRLKEAEIILDKITEMVTDPNLLTEVYSMAVKTFSAQQMQMKALKYQKKLAALQNQEPPLLN